MTETATITGRYVRTLEPSQTGLPTSAELWETSEPVDVGWLSVIRTRHLLLVRREQPGIDPPVEFSWAAATSEGLLNLRDWMIRESERFPTREALIAAAGFADSVVGREGEKKP